jgi:hypothetical protein
MRTGACGVEAKPLAALPLIKEGKIDAATHGRKGCGTVAIGIIIAMVTCKSRRINGSVALSGGISSRTLLARAGSKYYSVSTLP